MGWLDETIEDAAVADACAVADALAREPVTVIVSSPLRRAIDTAGPLADRLGLGMVLDDRFGELRVGGWEALTEDEISQRWPEHWATWRSEPHRLEVDGRETLAALNSRVGEALDELAASAGGAAVVFTHDAVARAAIAWALHTGPEIYRHVEVDNCSITTVRVIDGVRRLVRSNVVAHLPGPAVENHA
jgi:broad specificity phosphatase PhoE